MHILAKTFHFQLYIYIYFSCSKVLFLFCGKFPDELCSLWRWSQSISQEQLIISQWSRDFYKFTASPASPVGLQDNSETAFWHWDLPLTSVVSMTEEVKSTLPSLQILLIGKRIFGQGFFFFFNYIYFFAAARTLGIFMEEMDGEFRARLVALIYRRICRALEYI